MLDIAVYLSQFGVDVADRMIVRLEEACATLAEFPGMGRGRDELKPKLRSFPVGQYIVFYLPVDEGIRVMRVLHDSRNIELEFR